MKRYLRALGSVRGIMLLVLLVGLNLAVARTVRERSMYRLFRGLTLKTGAMTVRDEKDGSVAYGSAGPTRGSFAIDRIDWPWPGFTPVQRWLPFIASTTLSACILAAFGIRSGLSHREDRPAAPWWAWALVIALGLGLGVFTSQQALTRYDELNSGWSWDLAYYNQWFWALTTSDGILSVRPMAMYAVEGPSVWKMNYLAPIRFIIAPLYQLRPEPTTLLIFHAFLFWASVPAAFVLARDESGSTRAGLLAALLVPLTPLLEPLAANDFRELQLAMPFALLALAGVRGRRPWLACAGVSGLLACRQEFAMMVATLAIVPAREPEDLGATYRWARVLFFLGLGWTLLFLGYLRITSGPAAPLLYLQQFGGEKAPLHQTLGTSAEFLLLGLGTWGAVMWIQPRVGILVFPWVWNLASGRWALRYLSTTEWHHVRYAAPLAAIGLAAGVLGWASLWRRLGGKPSSHRAMLTVATILGLIGPWMVIHSRLDRAPRPLPADEARALRPYLEKVPQESAVLADYALTAPLSGRRKLYAYELEANYPPGFPKLGPDIRQVFARRLRIHPDVLTSQGFAILHEGPTIWVYSRDPLRERGPVILDETEEQVGGGPGAGPGAP